MTEAYLPLTHHSFPPDTHGVDMFIHLEGTTTDAVGSKILSRIVVVLLEVYDMSTWVMYLS